MNLDFDLSPIKQEVYQPQLPPVLPEFTKTAKDIDNTFPRFVGVLNTISDARADGYCPRKRDYGTVTAGLYQYVSLLAENKIRLVLGGQEPPEESRSFISVGSAAEMTETCANNNSSVKGMEHMNGLSNDALCFVKETGFGSSKLIDSCIEEQDYHSSINLVQDYLDKIKNIVMSGGSQDVLKAAVSEMEHVSDMLTSMSSSSALAHSRL